MKHHMFIGRFQSPHLGHMELFNVYLNKNQPILIAIRDVVNENDILTSQEVKQLWDTIYMDNDLVKVIIIPDILSVNYGRDVGYDVVQHHLPKQVESVSATYIRNCIINGIDDWRQYVSPKIHNELLYLIKSKY